MTIEAYTAASALPLLLPGLPSSYSLLLPGGENVQMFLNENIPTG